MVSGDWIRNISTFHFLMLPRARALKIDEQPWPSIRQGENHDTAMVAPNTGCRSRLGGARWVETKLGRQHPCLPDNGSQSTPLSLQNIYLRETSPSTAPHYHHVPQPVMFPAFLITWFRPPEIQIAQTRGLADIFLAPSSDGQEVPYDGTLHPGS